MNERVTIDGEVVAASPFVAYLRAMNRAQARIEPVRKTASNAHFKSRYADLGSIISQVGKILSEEGIVYWFEPGVDDGGRVVMWCCLAEATQGYVHRVPSISVPLPNGQNPFHIAGSASTYTMRYSFGQALGIALVDDDDGNDAAGDGRPVQRGPDVRPLLDKIRAAKTVEDLHAIKPEIGRLAPGPDRVMVIEEAARQVTRLKEGEE